MRSNSAKSNKPGHGLVLAACSRPALLLPAWLMAASGAAISGGSLPPIVPLLIVTVAFTLVLSALHAASLLADRHSDQVNGKNSFWQGRIPATIVARHAVGWAILGLLLSAWAHWFLLLPVTSILLLGFAYSLPPARLSSRWGWALLTNVLVYGVLIPWWGAMVFHWQPGVSEPAMDMPLTAVLLLSPLVALVYFGTTILEVKGHRESGKNTIAVRMNLTGDRHPKLLRSSIFAGILLAASPGLIYFPYLSVIGSVWLLLNYLLLRFVNKNQAKS